MECPFLKKISFKKVNQVVSDENDVVDIGDPEPT